MFSTLGPEKESRFLSQHPIQISKQFVLGKFNYIKDSRFVKIDPIHSSKDIYLQEEVYVAFIRMYENAKNDGISLKVISGTRSFNEQKVIWERKWTKYNYLEPQERTEKILEYSSMPSTSRHHWGTDLDLNSLNNSYFNSGNGHDEYEWLKANANNFGFYQVYTEKSDGRTGYNLERWHWSYLPLANKYLNYYNDHVEYGDIRGFKGDTLAVEIKMITKYVNGVSQKVKDYNND